MPRAYERARELYAEANKTVYRLYETTRQEESDEWPVRGRGRDVMGHGRDVMGHGVV